MVRNTSPLPLSSKERDVAPNSLWSKFPLIMFLSFREVI
jgi:hypothetical protein